MNKKLKLQMVFDARGNGGGNFHRLLPGIIKTALRITPPSCLRSGKRMKENSTKNIKLYNQIKRDQWGEFEYSMPIIARFGTGGGNTPIVLVTDTNEDNNELPRGDRDAESRRSSRQL